MTDYNKYSLYNNTTSDSLTRGYYESNGLKQDSTDMYVLVTSEYHQKPGKLSQFLYGTPRLGWIFSYFNRDTISDTIFDLREGMIIRAPTKERVLTYF